MTADSSADRPLRLLRITHTLRAESGGPSESVRRSTLALQRGGHQVEIVTLDRPEDGVPESELTVHALGIKPNGYGYTPKLGPWLQANRSRFDAVLVHGLWQFQGWGTFQALNGTAMPYLVFPHGMLDPWFRRTYPLKHWKKQLYWWWREQHVLRAAAAVCFTCEEERRLARESFRPYRINERVVAYGTADPARDDVGQAQAWREFCPQLSGRPFLLYLGRIHPKKGIDLLLRAYARIVGSGREVPALAIAGPLDQGDYVRELQALAAEICPAGTVYWPGLLSGTVKWGALRACEAFALTSHQENFGIAVAEALACGRPVLISRQVNIWREVIGDGAGMVADDTLDGAVELLETWTNLAPDRRAEMGAAARRCFERRYEITQASESLVRVVRESLRRPA